MEEGRGVFDNLTKFTVWTLPGDARDATVAAGEGGERLEVAPVLGDSALGGMAVELEPAEVLVDDLGERDAGHAPRELLMGAACG